MNMDIREKWNKKYEERIKNSGAAKPNERLEPLLSQLQGGIALDLACGLGANSFLLAKNGFEVYAYDVSEVAVDYIKKISHEQRLPIQAKVYDLSKFEQLSIEPQSIDLVVMTHYLERSLFPHLKSILKEGGYFFMETFYKSSVKKDFPERFKLDSQELRKVFTDWKILYFEENPAEGRQTIFCKK